jgi:squalene synthase HpnC
METIREEISSLSSQVTPTLIQSVEMERASSGPSRMVATRPGAGRVRTDLGRFGPGQAIPPMALDEANAYCQDLATEHYENFTVTSLLVPRRVRPHFASIYAYCRWSDDLADEIEDNEHSKQLLGWWRGQLEECFRGRAAHPVFLALRQTVAEYGLSQVPFQDLLSAFLQDQSKVQYESDAELLSYCVRSANPVGRLVVQLARVCSDQTLAWSDSICTGLQIANFCQDIQQDAKRERIYWPMERLRRWDIHPDLLSLDTANPDACCGVTEWANHARGYLLAGLPLVKHGPLWFARSVQLFVRGGLMVLRNIDSCGGDVWSRRIAVTKAQKLQLILRAILFPRSTTVPSIEHPRWKA